MPTINQNFLLHMSKNLVIVESPAKAKTIEKFLGPDYKVMSSYGHIRDLTKKDFNIQKGVDFEPEYEISDDKVELVKQLRKAAKEADTVWLASDEDREGEAIAWHLAQVLGLDPAHTKRIVFHEITKNAILNAIANPRNIDLGRVDAQQARRVLDRIVGFELSPVLWKKIKPALSAGRVQSVAVRLIVERENEIRNFIAEPYYRVTALMRTVDGATVKASLHDRLPDEKAVKKYLSDCSRSEFRVADVQVRPLTKSPAAPFTTSTLQQEAARKLGLTVSQTMLVAQRLYEAGHITYMRTDSLNLSAEALAAISSEIESKLGKQYLKVRHYHTSSKGAQEAHEAIRPTYVNKRELKGVGERERKLYDLIWKRTVASQMTDAVIEKTTVDIEPSVASPGFTASGETIKFDGFLKVYIESRDEEELVRNENSESETSNLLPRLVPGDMLSAEVITATERFTQHPPRYTEASLVKKMEELGIGRPSTYAPTISTIQQREYVEKGNRPGEEKKLLSFTLRDGEIEQSERIELTGADRGKLIPTDTGMVVNDFLTKFFPNVLDYGFTASVEERFDEIARGNAPWKEEITDFYEVFHPEVERANDTRFDHKPGERVLGVDPASGKPVSVKIGRFGPVVQIGDSADEEKPRFASLNKDQSVFDITLEEALKLFELPRTVGVFEDKPVTAAVGRFGPYLKHDGKFVSLPAGDAPETVTIDRAVELITAKRDADAKKIVKSFAEDPDVQLVNGRYGVYLAASGKNYKLPKDIQDPSALTIDDCRKIIAEADANPRPARSRRRKS